MVSKHITPKRMVDIRYGEIPTKEDIEAMYETISDYWNLTCNLAWLKESGAVIVLSNGEQLQLDSEIEEYILNEAEREQESRDQAYYGGD